MAIIRFVGRDQKIYMGFEIAPDRAEIAAGALSGGFHGTGEVAEVVRLLAPIEPTNIFGVGLNYRRHAEETGMAYPEHPILFMKPTSAVIGPFETVRLPACQMRGPEVDYEAELAVVIGKRARNLSVEEALDCVLGYTAANDISARRWQKRGGGGQWSRGKSFDTFCPLGPRIALAFEIPSPQALAIRCAVNGHVVQESNTADMIFNVAELLCFISRDTTLLPGTVILTGTPEGVGFVREPPRFLMPGDEVIVDIEGIGRLVNRVEEAE